MIKRSEKGITLIALVIMVIVILIILSITVTLGMSTINEIRDEKNEINLSVIQEVLIQQYTLLKSKGELGIIAPEIEENIALATDKKRPADILGVRLYDCSLLANNGFRYKKEYSANQKNMCFEDYYYYLDTNDLKTLNVTSDNELKATYIVNYSTGEVFDATYVRYKQTGYDTTGNLIYEEGTNSKKNNQSYDFTDE